jgi:hypothetical protein
MLLLVLSKEVEGFSVYGIISDSHVKGCYSLPYITLHFYNKMELGYFSWYSSGILSRRPGFNYRQGQEIFPFCSVWTSSGAHPTSYSVGIGNEVAVA